MLGRVGSGPHSSVSPSATASSVPIAGSCARRFKCWRRRQGALAVALVVLFTGLLTCVSGSRASAAPTSWSIVASPNTTSGEDWLTGVSCVNGTFCFAVGRSGYSTLVEAWNGSAWSITPSPNSPDQPSNSLSSVSCVSTTFCMAAGTAACCDYSYYPLFEKWNGSTWTLADENVGFGALRAVSCATTTFCMAVGGAHGVGADVLIETWDGTTWTETPSPDPGSKTYVLEGVSCVTATNCFAVGSSSDFPPSTSGRPLIERWDGLNWSVVSSPDLNSRHLSAVSCVTAMSCVAVGGTLVESWDGTSWVVTPSPNQSGYMELKGVSCDSPTSCAAVGVQQPSTGPSQTLTESWNGTSWSVVPSPNSGTGNDSLGGVSCTHGEGCQAVGVTYDSGGETLVLSGSDVADAPTNVTAVAGNQSASVSWVQPAGNGSPISTYTVTASPGGATATVPVTQTTATVRNLANGSTYTFTVTATNGVGTSPPSAPSAPVTPTAPAIETPSAGFVPKSAVGAVTVPVRESWPANSDANGICSYELQQSKAGGPYRNVTLPTPTSTSVVLPLYPSTSYGFRLRAIDCAGIIGDWGVQQAFSPLAWQETSTKLHYTGTWTRQSTRKAYGGALKYSTSQGASVTETFVGLGVAWISETGPTLGKATVYLDGIAVKTVNLYGSTLNRRLVVWKRGWSTQAKHNVKIVVVGTTGHPRVDLDAILTLHR